MGFGLGDVCVKERERERERERKEVCKKRTHLPPCLLARSSPFPSLEVMVDGGFLER